MARPPCSRPFARPSFNLAPIHRGVPVVHVCPAPTEEPCYLASATSVRRSAKWTGYLSSAGAPALLLEELASGIEQHGDIEGYIIFVSARSGPTRKDGVLVALCLRTFARSEVTAVHEIVRGKALGIRIKGKRGTEELDVHLVSANAPVVQPGDGDTKCRPPHLLAEL